MENERWVDEKMAVLGGHGAVDVDAGLAKLRGMQRARTRRVVIAGGVVGVLGVAAALPQTRAVAKQCVDYCGELIGGGATGIAPEFVLGDVRLSDYRGRVVLLNCWATWCRPCEIEIPWFIDFERAYGAKGLSVVGVSVDSGWDVLTPYIERKGITYKIALADDKFSKLYDVSAVPMTFLIDRAGRIAVTHAGLVPRDVYERDIVRLLG
jgi:cytochrome c biogenesis protein CcmG/thiol:disulfide interchange protein DsbE